MHVLYLLQKIFKKYGKNFGGKISFIITGDEEGEAINGTKKIMEWTKKQNIKIDHCLLENQHQIKILEIKLKLEDEDLLIFFNS